MGIVKDMLRRLGLVRDEKTQPGILTDLRPPLPPLPESRPESDMLPARAKEIEPNYGIGWDETTVTTDIHPSRGITFNTLRQIGKIPAVGAIIRTRTNQVAEFAHPVRRFGDLGFVIEPDEILGVVDPETQEECNRIAKWVLTCGDPACGHGEDFETFLRKLTPDSLELDQGCFEIRETMSGEIAGFQSVDSATIRFAVPDKQEQWHLQTREDMEQEGQVIQVLDGKIVAQWPRSKLAIGIRNPRTDLKSKGYGDPELYLLASVLSWMTDAEVYNAASFKNGSHAKGLLAVKSRMPREQFQQLRREFFQMLKGPKNAHKTMMLQLDAAKDTMEDIQYLNMARSNQEMEFAQWLGYLQKLTAAVFQMDPAEINFVYGSENQSGGLQQSSGASRVEYSREKGLRPLLRAIESWLNKWVITQKFPGYRLRFVGLDYEAERKKIEDLMKQTKVLSLNEIRSRMGYTPITLEMERSSAFADLPADAQYIHGVVSNRQHSFIAEMAERGFDAGGNLHNNAPEPSGSYDQDSSETKPESTEDPDAAEEDYGDRPLFYGPRGGAYLDESHKTPASKKFRDQRG